MQLYNLKHPEQVVSFKQAVRLGLGKDQGLFFPTQIPLLENIDSLQGLNFIQRSQQIFSTWLANEFSNSQINTMVERAFNFELPLVELNSHLYSLELFHGPTLAFKDFGARFMAQCLSAITQNEKITILTATSGDTGAAVADAFYGLRNINVVVLYPKGKISELQEKMFTTLGANIHTIAVGADFDACQQLVKACFDDQELRETLGLNSANSINISRLLAQICYYFEAVARFNARHDEAPIIAVPSGNLGNLTAALLAKAMGLPIKRIIAATNANDTLPRYLQTGKWQVKPTIETMSNAMDVATPNNWMRVAKIMQTMHWSSQELVAYAISESKTIASLKRLYNMGYLSEPHAAVAAAALQQDLTEDEKGIFLSTAHAAKFKPSVESILNTSLTVPKALAKVANKTSLALPMANNFSQLRRHLLRRDANL